MENITDVKFSRYINAIFISLLLLALSFNITITFSKTNFPLFVSGGVVSSIILIIASNKFRKNYPEINKVFYASIVFIIMSIISVVASYFLLKENAILLRKISGQFSIINNVYSDDLIYLLQNFKEPAFLFVGVYMITNSFPTIVMLYYLGKALFRISKLVSSFYGRETYRYSIKIIITMAVTYVLLIIVLIIFFSVLSTIDVNTGNYFFEDLVEKFVWLILLAPPIILAAVIVYIVFYIKLLIRVHKLAITTAIKEFNKRK